MSGTLHSTAKVTEYGRGFSTLTEDEVLCRTGLTISMVLMTPEGMTLKLTM